MRLTGGVHRRSGDILVVLHDSESTGIPNISGTSPTAERIDCVTPYVWTQCECASSSGSDDARPTSPALTERDALRCRHRGDALLPLCREGLEIGSPRFSGGIASSARLASLLLHFRCFGGCMRFSSTPCTAEGFLSGFSSVVVPANCWPKTSGLTLFFLSLRIRCCARGSGVRRDASFCLVRQRIHALPYLAAYCSVSALPEKHRPLVSGSHPVFGVYVWSDSGYTLTHGVLVPASGRQYFVRRLSRIPHFSSCRWTRDVYPGHYFTCASFRAVTCRSLLRMRNTGNHFGDCSLGKTRLCFQRADRTSDRSNRACPYSCSSWNGLDDPSYLHSTHRRCESQRGKYDEVTVAIIDKSASDFAVSQDMPTRISE